MPSGSASPRTAPSCSRLGTTSSTVDARAGVPDSRTLRWATSTLDGRAGPGTSRPSK